MTALTESAVLALCQAVENELAEWRELSRDNDCADEVAKWEALAKTARALLAQQQSDATELPRLRAIEARAKRCVAAVDPTACPPANVAAAFSTAHFILHGSSGEPS